MALDDKTLNKIKKEIRKGDKTLSDILKKLPDMFDKGEKEGERKPKLSPEQREGLKNLFEKYREGQKKEKIPRIVPKSPKRFDPYKPPERFIPDNERKFPDKQLLKGYKSGGLAGRLAKRGYGKSKK